MSDTSTHTSGASGSGKPRKKRTNIFSRMSLFLREVIAELREVLWPTRKELITYTSVVLVFVITMAAIVAALDFVFTKGVLQVFGGS